MTDMTSRPSTELLESASAAAALLRSMSNEHRLMILCRLGDGEKSVSELLEQSPLSQSALSQHLAVLRADGLVESRREGQSVLYRIADRAALQVIEVLMSIYCPDINQITQRRARP